MIANMEINNKGSEIDQIMGIFPLFPKELNKKLM